MTGNNWDALATEVRRRRGLLRLRQADLESRGGPSAGTVRNLEQASRTSYAPRTFVQLETALDWPDGLTRKILDGTASREEIDQTVHRVYARDSGVGTDHASAAAPLGGLHAKVGGAVARGAASGAQTVYPASIPSRAQVGEPTVTVGQNPTIVTVTELLRRLAKEENRTPTMGEAVDVLSRLLPELWDRPYEAPDPDDQR